MSEIFVEEENTVYELNEECLRRREKKLGLKESGQNYKVTKLDVNTNDIFIVLILSLFFCFMK
ncbi:MAG: hypothetical protein PHD56_07405 [Anaerostipes sp.]|nr:hypothetical protein [Anaerostipes sp.]